jgi:hypothetical protein
LGGPTPETRHELDARCDGAIARSNVTRHAVMHAAEAERRASRTDLVEQLFRSRPYDWISVSHLARVAGFCAWRTRVADARRRFTTANEGTIEWNGQTHASMYRYVPFSRLGRDAATITSQRSLF